MSNALGITSFIFGLISIFFLAPVFVPLALLLVIIAIIKKQLAWGIIGIICGIIGFVTSPILLGIFRLATIGVNIEREMTSTQNRPSQYNPLHRHIHHRHKPTSKLIHRQQAEESV